MIKKLNNFKDFNETNYVIVDNLEYIYSDICDYYRGKSVISAISFGENFIIYNVDFFYTLLDKPIYTDLNMFIKEYVTKEEKVKNRENILNYLEI